MKASAVRLNRQTKIWFYSTFSVLFFSGILWLILDCIVIDQTDFDSPLAPVGPALLKIHGAAAMASLVMLGVLIPAHMQRGWKQKRNLYTAFIMVALSVVMVASGYGLYYCGDDVLRSWVSGVHSAAGCLLPFILVWHIVSGRRSKK